MHVLLLTQWFEPEPTFKGLAFANELRKNGLKVTVLTGFPNYPGGQLYNGYDLRIYKYEKVEGISIHRVWLYPSHDLSAVGRAFNYISFALSAAVQGILRIKRPDVMYVYHPPLTISIPAFILSKIWRVKFVYDIQDLWPDTLWTTGMISSKAILTIVAKWANYIYQTASRIVVLSPGFKKKLTSRGVDPQKINVIYNWANESALGQNDSSVKGWPHDNENVASFSILFAGNMGKAQALDKILEGIRLTLDETQEVNFIFMGGGTEVVNLRTIAEKLGLNNTYFLPSVPMYQVRPYLEKADALLVHLKRDKLFEITIPSKIQTYLAVGNPILMGIQGDARKLVKLANAGVFFEPENPVSFKSAVLNMISKPETMQQMGQNGKEYYCKNLSIQKGVKKFIKHFKSIV